uniref:Alpha/beta hydrolase fold protein n=1 Tax=Cyanothece sp. (strain PCC 7425 / ATCC 29141) TaxID=395961 RepID=B8HYF3_CYAP4
MPYLEIRGVKHYYQWIRATEPPSPEAATKPVMIFLHGWAGSARYWESTAAALQDSFDCLLYDLRGFGRSKLPASTMTDLADYELETYAEDLALLLDHFQLQRVYLNAHSTGTSIAVFFLNLYPERVERAILTCAGIFTYDEPAFRQFHQFGGYVVKFRPPWLGKLPLLDRLFMARFLHRPVPPATRKAFLEDFLIADEAAALGTMFTAVSKKAAEVMPQEYAQLQVPTLLISGQYDQIIPPLMGEQAAQLNPSHIQQKIIPNTAHFPMLEDASTYLTQVQQFLQSQ